MLNDDDVNIPHPPQKINLHYHNDHSHIWLCIELKIIRTAYIDTDIEINYLHIIGISDINKLRRRWPWLPFPNTREEIMMSSIAYRQAMNLEMTASYEDIAHNVFINFYPLRYFTCSGCGCGGIDIHFETN